MQNKLVKRQKMQVKLVPTSLLESTGPTETGYIWPIFSPHKLGVGWDQLLVAHFKIEELDQTGL
jgi:hypothetical protein